MGIEKNSKAIVTNGLVLYLDPANMKCYSGSGTSVKDLSGNSFNGTLVNAVTYSTDNLGAFGFTTSNARYISIPHATALDPALGSFTVGLWARVANPVSGVYGLVFKGSESSNGRGWAMYFSQNRLIVRVNGSDTSAQKAAQTLLSFPSSTSYFYITLVVDRTNNVVLGYHNGTNTGWTNGEVTGTNVITGFGTISSTASVLIGRSTSNSNSYYLDGNTGPLHIYNRALSAAEVQQNYEAQKRRYGHG